MDKKKNHTKQAVTLGITIYYFFSSLYSLLLTVRFKKASKTLNLHSRK
jgi:hypothetical protein